MTESQIIGHHKVVTLQYSLSNADNVPIRDAGSAPIDYLHGCNLLFPKLESALEGHRVGDVLSVRLLPDDAFGKRDLDLVYEIPLTDLPTDETIEVGGELVGTGEDGQEVVFQITSIDNGMVHLDGNSPLAGQTLVFEVEIQGIREATAQEIAQQKAP